MNASLVGKITGWGQFGLQIFSQVAAAGLPHNALGWVGLAGSLIMAIGMHAASSTDGSK